LQRSQRSRDITSAHRRALSSAVLTERVDRCLDRARSARLDRHQGVAPRHRDRQFARRRYASCVTVGFELDTGQLADIGADTTALRGDAGCDLVKSPPGLLRVVVSIGAGRVPARAPPDRQ
jgi:hypothetical protein